MPQCSIELVSNFVVSNNLCPISLSPIGMCANGRYSGDVVRGDFVQEKLTGCRYVMAFTCDLTCIVERLDVTITDEVTKLKRWRETGRSGKKPQNKTWVRADERISENRRLLRMGR